MKSDRQWFDELRETIANPTTKLLATDLRAADHLSVY